MKRTLVRVWRWLERQGARLAQFSRHHARLGEFGFGVAFFGLCLHWLNLVVTPAFNAWAFPIGQPAYGHPWPRLFSPIGYGIPAFVLILIGYLAWRANRSWLIVGTTTLLVILGLTFFLQVTAWQPTWLRAAIDGGSDFERFYSFEVSNNIPHSVHGDPAGDLPLPVEGFSMRLVDGISALSSGWYFFMAGAIFCLIAALSRCRDWRELRVMAWLCPIAVVLAVGIQIWRPILAERAVATGVSAANRGQSGSALAHFREALALDQWNRLRPDLYERIGWIFQGTGQKDRPEYHLYRASQFEELREMIQAEDELDRAVANAGPELAEVVRREKSRVAEEYGKGLYSQGLLGEARKQLELAVAANPAPVAGYYLVGQCCYQASDYYAGIAYFTHGLSRTRQRTLIADLRTSIGDCYFKLGDVSTARSYYLASRAANDQWNYRALKSLTEDYYR
jgi:tetratricopeptide (TPR) repeat protein